MVMVGIIVLFTNSKWENTIISDILFLIGICLVGIATIGRLWCSVYISGYKIRNLITTGPYSICRNPLYFFSLLGSVGVGLATETLTIPVIISIAFALYYPHVIKKEEERLLTVHGDKFKNYCKKIPKFIPSFSSYVEPEEYTIKPQILRKRFFDSLWFVWIVGILEIIEALHEHDIIPIFFNLY